MEKKIMTLVALATIIVSMLSLVSAVTPVNAVPEDPWLEVKPSYYMTSEMEIFNVEVWLNDVTTDKKLIGVQFGLLYNNTLLEVVDVAEGAFLPSFPNRPDPPYTWFTWANELDGLYGPHVLVGELIFPNATNHWNVFPEGSGKIATITFRGIYPRGSCVLGLTRVVLAAPGGIEIPHGASKNGYYDIWPLLCDVNRDKKVNIQDVCLVARAFGSVVGDIKWNPRYNLHLRPDNLDHDRNGPNEVIDINELAIFKNEFGKRVL